MATTNIRWGIASHLLAMLRNSSDLAGVGIHPGWPGDRATSEIMWIMGFDGTVEIPVLTGGRKQRDDIFTIPLEIRTTRGNSLDAVFERLTDLIAAVENILADDPSLGGLDGLMSAEITDERMTCGLTDHGHIGFAEITISVHTRLL